MKFRGPSASLRPAREQARAAARTTAYLHQALTTTGGSNVSIPGWRLATDNSGRLVAINDSTGSTTVVAA
ncbi:hypothetical protein FB384_004890 [Prauserella sediminis]|uniref:Uncharacterized protein n=1 Tax=Prauserella sediminis TaxID=577680 RepID=A0A839XT98_9PSEU|nr:hypothetical protein [Prauserella sediminis]MBB3665931.1 hypothetical protein [Prauserella sediminis]